MPKFKVTGIYELDDDEADTMCGEGGANWCPHCKKKAIRKAKRARRAEEERAASLPLPLDETPLARAARAAAQEIAVSDDAHAMAGDVFAGHLAGLGLAVVDATALKQDALATLTSDTLVRLMAGALDALTGAMERGRAHRLSDAGGALPDEMTSDMREAAFAVQKFAGALIVRNRL